jgi:hypothetical protein
VWPADLLEWFAKAEERELPTPAEWFAKAEERELPTPAEWSSEASQMGMVASATTQRR